MEKELSLLECLGIGFMIFIVITIIFEAVVFGAAYFNADEITCNLFGCKFKTTMKDVTTISSSSCYENGIPINCSDVDWPEIK